MGRQPASGRTADVLDDVVEPVDAWWMLAVLLRTGFVVVVVTEELLPCQRPMRDTYLAFFFSFFFLLLMDRGALASLLFV